MKVIKSVLIAGTLCTALTGTAVAGQSFAEQAQRALSVIKKSHYQEAVKTDFARYGLKKRDLRKIVRETARKLERRVKRKPSWKYKRKYRR